MSSVVTNTEMLKRNQRNVNKVITEQISVLCFVLLWLFDCLTASLAPPKPQNFEKHLFISEN